MSKKLNFGKKMLIAIVFLILAFLFFFVIEPTVLRAGTYYLYSVTTEDSASSIVKTYYADDQDNELGIKKDDFIIEVKSGVEVVVTIEGKKQDVINYYSTGDGFSIELQNNYKINAKKEGFKKISFSKIDEEFINGKYQRITTTYILTKQ